MFLFFLLLSLFIPPSRIVGEGVEERSHCIYNALMGYLLMMNRMSLHSLYICMDGFKLCFCFALMLRLFIEVCSVTLYIHMLLLGCQFGLFWLFAFFFLTLSNWPLGLLIAFYVGRVCEVDEFLIIILDKGLQIHLLNSNCIRCES